MAHHPASCCLQQQGGTITSFLVRALRRARSGCWLKRVTSSPIDVGQLPRQTGRCCLQTNVSVSRPTALLATSANSPMCSTQMTRQALR